MPSDSRLKDLRKIGKIRIMSKLHGTMPQCPALPPKRKFYQD